MFRKNERKKSRVKRREPPAPAGGSVWIALRIVLPVSQPSKPNVRATTVIISARVRESSGANLPSSLPLI